MVKVTGIGFGFGSVLCASSLSPTVKVTQVMVMSMAENNNSGLKVKILHIMVNCLHNVLLEQVFGHIKIKIFEVETLHFPCETNVELVRILTK